MAYTVTALMLINTAYASGAIRCGSYIVEGGGRSGPGRYEVLKKCGEPTSKRGDVWIYERGGGGTRVLIFNQAGILDRVETP